MTPEEKAIRQLNRDMGFESWTWRDALRGVGRCLVAWVKMARGQR